MNEQMRLLSSLEPGFHSPPLPERAQRIRDLVGTARTCIIEVGHELIKAKDEVEHGDWLSWLVVEFGWSERTAYNYMNVAQSFATVASFDGLTIDVSALYALSSPEVPQSARDEVIALAETGEHITRAHAAELIKAATSEATENLRQALREQRDEAAVRTKTAIETAEKRFAKDRAKLEAEIARIKSEDAEPDVGQAIAMFCRILGRSRLSPNQMRLLAQVMGEPITDGRQTYQPVTDAQARTVEANIAISSGAARALEYFAAAPTPAEVFAASYPVQLAAARRHIDAAAAWIAAFSALLKDGEA